MINLIRSVDKCKPKMITAEPSEQQTLLSLSSGGGGGGGKGIPYTVLQVPASSVVVPTSLFFFYCQKVIQWFKISHYFRDAESARETPRVHESCQERTRVAESTRESPRTYERRQDHTEVAGSAQEFQAKQERDL